MKEEAHKFADDDPQELLKSFNKKSKTKEDKEDYGNPPSNRSNKTDPITKSFFSKNGK